MVESPSRAGFKGPADVALGTRVRGEQAVLGLDLKDLFQSK